MADVKGKGSQLQLDIATVYTKIAQVVSLDGPGLSVATADSTDLDSTGFEFCPTLTDSGSVSGELKYDPGQTTHQSLQTLILNPSVESWKIILTDTGTTEIQFDGVLDEFQPTGITADGLVKASFNIKINGSVTFVTS